jgi:hypothetical protein
VGDAAPPSFTTFFFKERAQLKKIPACLNNIVSPHCQGVHPISQDWKHQFLYREDLQVLKNQHLLDSVE